MIALVIGLALAEVPGWKASHTSGNHDAAANAAVAALSGDEAGEAWVRLGQSLDGLELPYASLLATAEGAALAPEAAAPRIERAFVLADQIGDERVLGSVFAENIGIPVTGETQARVAVAAARAQLSRGELGTALGVLSMVQADSPSFVDAQLLKGVLLSQQDQHAEAIAPLVTAQQLARQQERGDRFDDLLDLNLGRTYYAAENWGQAIVSFSAVDRTSEFWPEARFERAWAHFRANDMQGALGQLMVHRSPFFEEWNFAEADLLRAYALFLLCKFPEASKDIDRFVETYQPMKEGLDGTLPSLSAESAFEQVKALREGKDTKIPKATLRSFMWDDRFGDALRAVDAADAELAILESKSGAWTDRARTLLKERRAALIESEGERVKSRLRSQAAQLDEMLAGIEITRLDLLNFETQLYEKAAATGELDFGDKIGKLRKIRKRKRAQIWPFEGEYWVDELGYYMIDTRADCPADMAVKP